MLVAVLLPTFSCAMVSTNYSFNRIVGMGVAAVLAYTAHTAIRTPAEFTPTTENLNIFLLSPTQFPASQEAKRIAQLVKDIQGGNTTSDLLCINRLVNPEIWAVSNTIMVGNAPDIFIYARGNSDRTIDFIDNAIGSTGTPRSGGGMLECYNYIKQNIINGPAVSFDFPDSQGTISFGQENEKKCLDVAFGKMLGENPNVPINFVGFCRGGRVGLELASENPHNLETMILESPFITLEDAARHMGKSYMWFMPGSGSLMYNVMRYIFPSYNPELDNLLEKLPQICPDLPILIGHLSGDKTISREILYEALGKMRHCKNLYLFVVEDTTHTLFHGKLNTTGAFQKVCNAFLARYGKTHNAKLAKEGQDYLEMARINASKPPHEWKVITH